MYKILCWSSGKAGGILNVEHYLKRGDIPFTLHTRIFLFSDGAGVRGDDNRNLFRVYFLLIRLSLFYLTVFIFISFCVFYTYLCILLFHNFQISVNSLQQTSFHNFKFAFKKQCCLISRVS